MPETKVYTHREVALSDYQPHHDGLGLNDKISIHKDAVDPEAGNASHCYALKMDITGTATAIDAGCTGKAEETVGLLRFQHGPRLGAGSVAGLTNEAVLAVVLDRLKGFQSGPFACRENALAITKLEEALHWMNARARARARQGVLGKNEQHK